MIRRLFAGTNSGAGFFSFFNQIIGNETKLVYLLKGGPGTGKSRFMQDIAEDLEGRNFVQEKFYCSSDPFSLDALHLPQLGVAIIDATAPHALEAEWPGCRDQLICLGDFWSADGLIERRREIVEAGLEKRAHFAAAFRYFGAADLLEQNIAARSEKNGAVMPEIAAELTRCLDGHKQTEGHGGVRRLFASALTPQGHVSFAAEIAAGCSERFLFTGIPGGDSAALLTRLVTKAELLGLNVETFHYPLDPKRIQHLLIPGLNIGFFSETMLETLDNISGDRIACSPIEINGSCNAGDQKLFRELIDRGVQSLRHAQESHGEVEEFYASQMDFSRLALARERVLQEILSL